MHIFFFFNDTATTEIYTLSLHDALPIWLAGGAAARDHVPVGAGAGALSRRGLVGVFEAVDGESADRKSTRLNSSHSQISYAVFCLKKKKNTKYQIVRL